MVVRGLYVKFVGVVDLQLVIVIFEYCVYVVVIEFIVFGVVVEQSFVQMIEFVVGVYLDVVFGIFVQVDYVFIWKVQVGWQLFQVMCGNVQQVLVFGVQLQVIVLVLQY